MSATYALADYTDAIAHAASAGRRGASEGRLRPAAGKGAQPLMPRPGFVLDVDRSTPPTLFWHGEGFSLEKLPPTAAGSSTRPSRSPPLDDVDGAIRHALLHPIDCDPLPALLFPGMKLTIAFDDVSPAAAEDAPARHRASASSRPCSTWPPTPASTTSTSSPRSPCTAG